MQALIYLALFIAGALLGSQINHAIYRWLLFSYRPYSPWMKPPEGVPPRDWQDRIPIWGWWRLRREAKHQKQAMIEFEESNPRLFPFELQSKYYKDDPRRAINQSFNFFWVRPLLIELIWAFGMIGLWRFHVEMEWVPLLWRGAVTDSWVVYVWMTWHVVLLALMTIATFIDFEEQLIPDQITIPATIGAIVLMAAIPQAQLPVAVTSPKGLEVHPLHFNTPDPFPGWATSEIALAISIAILVVWTISILPIRWTLRFGWQKGIGIAWRSIVRPIRNRPAINGSTQPRVQATVIVFILAAALLLVGVVMLWSFRQQLPAHWQSLFTSLLGMGTGFGIVWSVRIAGKAALGKEAMGFGDVTLMGLIGALVGWQSAFIIFMLSPFSALAVTAVKMFTKRQHEIPYGPYLCLTTAALLFFWSSLWNEWASESIFSLGTPTIFGMLGVGIIALGLSLFVYRLLGGGFSET
jgi:leader peptidase (prepilin peptidase) / N-methyltransferase